MANRNPGITDDESKASDSVPRPLMASKPGSVRAILLYRTCDHFSAGFLMVGALFAPWAFGTTQLWSIWTMNSFGYLLLGLLVLKVILRKLYSLRPDRWDPSPGLTLTLKWLTAAILTYMLTAALNARAVYNPLSMDFGFRPHLSWLPHSYDQAKSWQAFANYLALAGFFWNLRDWLLGKTDQETRFERSGNPANSRNRALPARIRWLLWILCLNGALLATEAIIQRVDGGGKLLWLVEPRVNKEAISQLGPYAYRANGAQYFNLVWPLGMGLWWMLRREARQSRDAEAPPIKSKAHVLLPAVLLMAACPIISASRGGAVVTVAGLFGAAAIVVTGLRRRHPAVKFASLLFFASVLSTGLYLGWDQLSDRLQTTQEAYLGRDETYTTARNIARDYPLFGTGPGSFESVFQLYRTSTDEYWPAQLHNDWLETLVTFGWLGSALIALAFICVVGRWLLPGEISVGWRFPACIWLALGGCLIHARFDFPFQVYSILHLFLMECAILSVLSRRPPPR